MKEKKKGGQYGPLEKTRMDKQLNIFKDVGGGSGWHCRQSLTVSSERTNKKIVRCMKIEWVGKQNLRERERERKVIKSILSMPMVMTLNESHDSFSWINEYDYYTWTGIPENCPPLLPMWDWVPLLSPLLIRAFFIF